jgi:hypothetical protein
MSVVGGVAWVADSSPYMLGDTSPQAGAINTAATVVDWLGSDTIDTKREMGNSANHRFEGQNVGYSDGAAIWQQNANCGYDHDNIYSAWAAGSVNADQKGTCTAASVNRDVDSFIMP